MVVEIMWGLMGIDLKLCASVNPKKFPVRYNIACDIGWAFAHTCTVL